MVRIGGETPKDADSSPNGGKELASDLAALRDTSEAESRVKYSPSESASIPAESRVRYSGTKADAETIEAPEHVSVEDITPGMEIIQRDSNEPWIVLEISPRSSGELAVRMTKKNGAGNYSKNLDEMVSALNTPGAAWRI